MKRFNESTRRMLGRKVTLDQAPRVRLHDEVLGPVDLVHFDGSDSALGAICAERDTSGADPHFFARDDATGDVFAVNTEGYTYPRYLGRLNTRDAEKAVVFCREPQR